VDHTSEIIEGNSNFLPATRTLNLEELSNILQDMVKARIDVVPRGNGKIDIPDAVTGKLGISS
jgi:hypothetical protein